MSDFFNNASDFLQTNTGRWILAGGIIGLFILLALFSRFIIRVLRFFITRRTRTNLDDFIIDALKSPVFVILIVLGLWIGISKMPVKTFQDHLSTIHNIFVAVYIAIGAVTLSRVLNAVISWYGQEVAVKTKSDLDDKLLPLIRRVLSVVIIAVALMIILSELGINISPILAGLGIGGLAVALALQPTLINFLAGTYVVSDAVIHKGDYILMDNGVEGCVENIGWRTTRLINWQGNTVIMPNAKLADAIVTDFEGPDQDKGMTFKIDCGVSYSSDLDKVEKVTREVGAQVMQNSADGVKDFDPQVKFKAFADSNIQFTVVLKAKERTGQFTLKHEFIKALHKRFKEEGIDMEFPVRKIYFANGANNANIAVKSTKGKSRKISVN